VVVPTLDAAVVVPNPRTRGSAVGY